MNDLSGNKNNNNDPVTRSAINRLIQKAQETGDWSKVENANVSEMTDMSNLFYNLNGIKDLDLSSWDTSNTTNMSMMFSKSDFNAPLNFDTSKVEDMSFMFSRSNFNHPLNFDTCNVVTMSMMFSNSVYNHPLYFNTSNVGNMASMFANSKYNHPLNFDTSNVKDMSSIFKGSEFSGDISAWNLDNIKENKANRHVIEYRNDCIERNDIREEKKILDNVIENNSSTDGKRISFRL